MRPFVSRPKWQQRFAMTVSTLFAWSAVLALPAQALAHASTAKQPGVRSLTLSEMQRITGSQGVLVAASVDSASGSTYPWEASVGGTNTSNGNKLTTVPLVGWTVRGGMPLAFTLAHNSQSTYNSELGHKWTHSFDLFLLATTGSSGTDQTAHWGDGLSYKFTQNIDGSYTAPTGIHDVLVKNTDSTYTLTKPDQTKYHYTSAGYCDTITDRNANQIGLTYTTGNFVSTITDSTGRTVTLSYDTSNRISTVTDTASHVWSLAYDTNNNLSTVTYPVLGTTYYSETLGYNSAHDITTFTDKRGHNFVYTYNSDDSIATESDPYSNQTSYSYTSTATTVTDPNSHSTVYTYSSGKLSQLTDAASQSESYVYDTANNRTQKTDKRGYVWTATFDSAGNVLTTADPYTNTTTTTFNSHHFPLTVTIPTGEQTVFTRDTHDNVTAIAQKDSGGTTRATTTFTVNSYGLTTDKYDANSHHYQYGFDTNGDMTSTTTPNSHVTSGVYNTLGQQTSKTDALSRTTTYTLDAWGRVATTTYPDSSTKTFSYDANSNVTQFVDATGTTARYYDSDNRIIAESLNGSWTVGYAYDATGQLGLLNWVSDIDGRKTYYTYTSRNQIYSAADSAGTTVYTYDAAGNETTGIANPNGTRVVKAYDHAGRLTSISDNNSSGTPLVSFSYTYDTDGRKTGVTEADTSTVSYGYDWGGRLTSEVRTGTCAETISYTVDAVGNRTSQTIGTQTTAFTLNSDDELTATSSSTGGFVNSYSYNANGEQTGRTLSGTAYTLAYDYDGQLLSTSVGGSTQSSFAYDATG
ncbi:MAG: repeat-containing protein, partial [Chthonomonadaceae bacterium]|nr:repeat-containing protein [Chthonomonadaceae bacterium]